MTPMTPDAELAKVRARLEHMVALAEAATPGPWTIEQDGDLDWSLVGTLNDGRLVTCGFGTDAEADTAYLAAVSPDLLLCVAREALDMLDRHRSTAPASSPPLITATCSCCSDEEDFCTLCDDTMWPCPQVRSVLRAWLP